MEGAGVGDPFALKVCRVEDDALVAAAEDGALALGVDEDEGLGAGNSGSCDDVGFDAGVGEGFAMKCSGEVVAEFADVAGAESPLRAGNDRGGDLAAGEGADGGVFGFGAASGIGGERDDGVGGVEAYADEVNLRLLLHRLTVNEPMSQNRDPSTGSGQAMGHAAVMELWVEKQVSPLRRQKRRLRSK